MSGYENVNKSKRHIRLVAVANRISTNNTVGPDVKSIGNKSRKPVVTYHIFLVLFLLFTHLSFCTVVKMKQNKTKKKIGAR